MFHFIQMYVNVNVHTRTCRKNMVILFIDLIKMLHDGSDVSGLKMLLTKLFDV